MLVNRKKFCSFGDMEMESKLCKACMETKPYSEFNKDNRSKKHGLQSKCKECQMEYYLKNRERYQELRKGEKYYKKQREYFLNHKNNINEYKRERYSTELGKAKVKSNNQEYRSLKRTTSDGTVTFEFILRKLSSQNYKCAISGKCIKNNYHIDHIIPLSKGGLHTSSNIQLLHPKVNMSKKDNLNYEYK